VGSAVRVELGLAALGVVLCALSACVVAPVVARPATPRTVTAGATTIGLDHVRGDFVAVSDRGSRVEAGWLADGPAAGATCRVGVPATAVGAEEHGLAAPDGSPLVELRFQSGVLIEHLARPTSLTLQLADATCAVLPLASAEPDLTYRIGSGALWNAGGMFSYFTPLAGRGDVGAGIVEWDPVRIGRWTGPVQPTVAVGAGMTSRLFELHAAGVLMSYPLVFRRLAVGLGAGYEIRPSWAHDFADGARFKWIHGPRLELHLVTTLPTMLGFPAPVKLPKVGLAVWASRLDADRFSATILGIGIVRD
jgi:hypothetical protein